MAISLTPTAVSGWTVPEDEVHRPANQQVRGHAAVIMGRGLYEMMVPILVRPPGSGEGGEIEQEFAMVWDEIPSSLPAHPDRGSRDLPADRGDAVDWIARKKAETDGDIEVSGIDPRLPGRGSRADRRLPLQSPPVVLGGGKPFFPGNGTRRDPLN